MNILPKKRWHVRTKENIARVRKDEAKAAEEEKIRQERAKLAESEARRQLLLEKSRQRFETNSFIPLDAKQATSVHVSITTENEHINFFKDLEEGIADQKQTNKEHDEEIKKEKEKYEKQIGYLTYLGQDTNEALGKKSWYEILPERLRDQKGEVNLKSKSREDPLMIIKKYTNEIKKVEDSIAVSKFKEYKSVLHNELKVNYKSSKKQKRHSRESSEERLRKRKKHKSKNKHHRSRSNESSTSRNNDKSTGKLKKVDKSYNSSSENEDGKLQNAEKQRKLQQLRAERFQRERVERKKTEELLSKIKGNSVKEKCEETRGLTRKYNSQFNPELAKQNYS